MQIATINKAVQAQSDQVAYTVMVSPEMGRGLYATRDLAAGETIMDCELLVLSETDTPIVNSTDLQWYTFKYDKQRDCLVLGLGEIFNHDDAANVNYELVLVDGRHMMRFSTNQPVVAGDQLFIDYTADADVDVSGYTVNLG